MSARFFVLLALAMVVMSGCQRGGGDVAANAPSPPTPASSPAPSKPAMSEQDFRKGMAIEGVREVRYAGTDGKPLAFADFVAAIQGGRSFRKEVELDKSLAVMTLNPPEPAAPAPVVAAGESAALNIPASAKLPPIGGTDLDGRPIVLADGKQYTLVSFFFADCVPCIREIPALNALARESNGLRVVSVTFEPRDVALQFSKARGLETSIVPDSQAFIDEIGIKVYPTLVLVSPEGRLMGARSSYDPANADDSGLAGMQAWIASLGARI